MRASPTPNINLARNETAKKAHAFSKKEAIANRMVARLIRMIPIKIALLLPIEPKFDPIQGDTTKNPNGYPPNNTPIRVPVILSAWFSEIYRGSREAQLR